MYICNKFSIFTGFFYGYYVEYLMIKRECVSKIQLLQTSKIWEK